MLKALPYLIAALVAIGAIIQGANALYLHVKLSGVESCELARKDRQIETLAKAAQHIVNEQAKLEHIQKIIDGDSDNSKVVNSIVLRTVDSVSTSCAGKTSC